MPEKYRLYWKHADEIEEVAGVAELFDVIFDVYVNANTRLEIAGDTGATGWFPIVGPA